MQRFSRNALPLRRRMLRIGLPAALIALAALFMHRLLGEALALILGAAAVAFLLEPLTRGYERRLARPRAALAAMGTVLGALAAAIWLLLPSLIQEATLLARQLPESLKQVQSALASASAWLEAQLPGVRLPEPQLDSAMLSSLAGGTLSVAGSVADFSCLVSLMFVLGYFFLCDRDRLLIRMELLVPRAVRPTAVRMGNAVCRELRLYLRGQGLIALAVGALAAVGLALIGLRSALVLGVIVGVEHDSLFRAGAGRHSRRAGGAGRRMEEGGADRFRALGRAAGRRHGHLAAHSRRRDRSFPGGGADSHLRRLPRLRHSGHASGAAGADDFSNSI